MHVLVVPDSFKGSLSAAEVCGLVGEAFVARGATTRLIPVADGGEGTVDAMLLAAGGERRVDTVQGPYGQPLDAARAILPDGTALVELAQAAGLTLVGEDRRAGDTTTYGVGEQIRAAAAEGARRIIVGIGGSATNDGGCGAAAACGVRFLDDEANEFVPVGRTLTDVAVIDLAGLDPAVAAAEIVVMCDVDNPLTGEHGAAAVFGPQKGADPETVAQLDAGLRHLAEVVRRDVHVDVEGLDGAGAAGGMGGGLVAFLGGTLRRGIDVVLDAVRFEEQLAGADAVVTGEGSFDSQSLRGKVVHGIAARAQPAGVPVHVLAGRVDEGVLEAARTVGVASATAITPPGVPIEQAIAEARTNLARAAAALAERLV
ncbi:glycerate kinase [Tessaracoccus oleiagri]|uniref:Glycerate kinase n=1 Tax=Tessaracoccus oleiagri TaxID=686624 RepID=A0A1G9KRK8_9ACTN|nr:glycerate kinase [Tessaracoccus oleiagri]SDL52341.1 glycerate kinase [Tessaracoccus oleiagri]